MSVESVDKLLDEVYHQVESYDPKTIAKAYDYDVIKADIGPHTLGTRITNSRCTTIILDENLDPSEESLVFLHEIKHCLTDKGVGTPFLRKMKSIGPLDKREYEANIFAMHAMLRTYGYDIEGLNKSQICHYFGLDDYWFRYI